MARAGGDLPARLASQKAAGRRFLRRAWTRRASLRLCAVQGQQGRSCTARAAEGEARPHLPRDLHQAGACAPAVLLVPFFRCFRSRSRSCSSCAWGSRPVAGGRCSCSAARARVRSRRRPAHPLAFARTQTRQNAPPSYVPATPAPHDPTFPLALAYASCPHHTTPTRQHHSCSPAIKKHACAAASPAPCLRRPLFARAFGRVALPHVLPPTLAPCPLPARRPPSFFSAAAHASPFTSQASTSASHPTPSSTVFRRTSRTRRVRYPSEAQPCYNLTMSSLIRYIVPIRICM